MCFYFLKFNYLYGFHEKLDQLIGSSNQIVLLTKYVSVRGKNKVMLHTFQYIDNIIFLLSDSDEIGVLTKKALPLILILNVNFNPL